MGRTIYFYFYFKFFFPYRFTSSLLMPPPLLSLFVLPFILAVVFPGKERWGKGWRVRVWDRNRSKLVKWTTIFKLLFFFFGRGLAGIIDNYGLRR